jgi:hypothetical protein
LSLTSYRPKSIDFNAKIYFNANTGYLVVKIMKISGRFSQIFVAEGIVRVFPKVAGSSPYEPEPAGT